MRQGHHRDVYVNIKFCVGITAKEFAFVVRYSFPAHLTFSARFSFSIEAGRLFSVTSMYNICIIYVYPNYGQRNRNVIIIIIAIIIISAVLVVMLALENGNALK